MFRNILISQNAADHVDAS